jgi:hypothetical protein
MHPKIVAGSHHDKYIVRVTDRSVDFQSFIVFMLAVLVIIKTVH